MRAHRNTKHQPARRAGRRNGSRGVALVTTLLILMLLVAMTLAMTISVTSDTLINKYYRNARSSFYAADSGVNIARQYMINQLEGSVSYSTDYTTNTPPLSTTETATALSNTLTHYATSTSIVGGLGTGSWPSSFQIDATYTGTVGTTLPSTTPTPTCAPITSGSLKNTGPYTCPGGSNVPQCSTGTSCVTGYTYSYTIPYAITAIGSSLASEQQVVEDEGTITLNVTEGQTASPTFSFAGWGMFINTYPICTDGDLVPGTITGPVFTNGGWTFSTAGTYTFTGTVGSVQSNFGYDFGGGTGCVTGTAGQTSDKVGGTTIAPIFQGGPPTLGASSVGLPANDFNQKEAVVDGLGNTWTTDNYTTAQQDTLMAASLKTQTGTAYPSAGTTNDGVYLPYSSSTTGGVTTDTMTGGGIYVEGDADNVALTASTASSANAGLGQASGDSLQVITITQGTTVTTVTEDLTTQKTAMQTKVGSGSTTTQLILGLPSNLTGSSSSPATMLYVDGNIGNNSNNDGLTGAGENSAAIQNGEALTVTAAGNVDITGSILYSQEPVTTVASQSVSSSLTTTACCSGDPVDTLIPYKNEPTSVFGIFTATGQVELDNQQSDGNLEIDASVATISSGGSGGIENVGNSINTLTIVGGRIQNTIENINTTTRNVDFDQRFKGGTFAPPWFPSTTLGATATISVNGVTPTFQRTLWQSLN